MQRVRLLTVATAYLLLLLPSSIFSATVSDSAENGAIRFGVEAADGVRSIAKVPGNWDVINGRFSADGASHSFRFLHEGFAAWPIDQWLLPPNTITPAANTKLVFKSMLGLMEAGESALVQVSTSTAAVPPENSWVTVYSQAGSGHSVETTFQNREVSLGGYAGQAIRVRFVYAWNGTQGWYWQNVEGNDQGWSSGWYLDRIELNTGGAVTQIDGAENGVLKNGTDAPDGVHSLVNLPPDWNVINTRYTGDTASHSFRFLHEGVTAWPTDHWLMLPQAMVPTANSKLLFKSMLGLIEAGEAAVVQVSTSTAAEPPESSWINVYVQAGSGHSVETTFANREISLAAFAGQPIRIRFVYAWNGTQGWYWQDIQMNDQGWSSGWYFDRIQVTNVEIANTPTPPTPMETWRMTYFGNSSNTGDGADLFDKEGDGVPNLFEYAFGMNPNLPDTSEMPALAMDGDHLTVAFTRMRDATDLTYRVEACDDLALDQWREIWTSSPVPYDGGTSEKTRVTVTDPTPAGQQPARFLRVKVTKP